MGDTTTCVDACTSEEQACAAVGREADFQDDLTCIGDAGGIPVGTALDPNEGATDAVSACAAEATVVTDECGN